ncbi:MAG: HAMP domain-containing histidine kinase [Sphingobium sp.]|nr:HAMP domain-containing histidine kinase [Sphingobium sp.]
MQPIVRMGSYSLRHKLEAASWAGLIATAVLAGLLLFIASTASRVLNAARVSHDRVQVFTQLDRAVSELQILRYQQLRHAGPRADQSVAIGSSKVQALLRQAVELPASTAHDRAVALEIAKKGREAQEYLVRLPLLMRQVDATLKEAGSSAGMRELRRVSAPLSALTSALQREIRAGGADVAIRTADAHKLLTLAVGASVIGFLLAVGLSSTIHVLLHKRLRPGLVGLERGAQSFAQGKLDYRIELPGSDELARLATAFNLMAQALAEKQKTLQEAQIDLEQKVADRTQQLQLANAKLSVADERRRAFLADVSHELRTPLTIIRGETEIALRMAENASFDANDVFGRILQQTRDLGRMVDDLFVIALAESGALPLDREKLDLFDVASRVASDFGTLANEAGGSVSILPGPRCHVSGDPERVRRAIAALIENAMRHCQPAVKVEIEVGMIDGYPNIVVTDDGPGIDPSIASGLFERFKRGDTRGEGSGLGLSLVSALMEAHGGRAYLAAAPNGGTRAVLEFPDSTHPEAAA